MKATITTVIIILIIILGIYYFSNNKPAVVVPYVPPAQETTPTTTQVPVSQTQTTTTTTSTTTSTTPANVSVSISNFSFVPASLSVKAGTKVTWTNNDSVAHTVTDDSGSIFDSGPIAPGGVFSFTFVNPGSFSYHCSIHPMMKAVVSVQS